jgi:rfaE bifunctional protein kinase chain/domain
VSLASEKAHSTAGVADGDPFEGADLREPRLAAAILLGAMAQQRVLVVGDVFLDEYLVGRSERLSREAPVPVLAFSRRFCLPGGAANPAHNVSQLGAEARQVALVGDDAAGVELREALSARAIDASALVVDAGRPTTRKTRVIAEGLAAPQQVARLDHLSRERASGATEAALVAAIGQAGTRCDAVLVSHYGCGVVTPAVVEASRIAARRAGAILAVDAQGDLELFHGFDVVRVGRADAASHLGRPLDDESDYQSAANDLRTRLAAGAVLLGRGAAGASVADEAGYTVVPAAQVSEVFDVAGAGDTVIAVVTLALAAGATVRDAVRLANRAAGIVVRRLGVAAPTPAEILESFDEWPAQATKVEGEAGSGVSVSGADEAASRRPS